MTETDTVRIRQCSEKRSLLEKCAQTALNSKLIAHQKEFFGEMAVDAVMSLEDDLNLKMIGVKKVPGGSLTDSVLVKGVAFKKTFSYAGFEQQVRTVPISSAVQARFVTNADTAALLSTCAYNRPCVRATDLAAEEVF